MSSSAGVERWSTDGRRDRAIIDAARQVRDVPGWLQTDPGQDIVVTGSIMLCHTLIEASLVDEYRLFVYPVVQGRGRRLFLDGFECPELRLLEAKSFRSGSTYSR